MIDSLSAKQIYLAIMRSCFQSMQYTSIMIAITGKYIILLFVHIETFIFIEQFNAYTNLLHYILYTYKNTIL